MALRSCGQSPDRAGVIVYSGVEVVIVLRASLYALSAVIRRWFRVPDQIVDLDEGARKVPCLCVVNAKIFSHPLDLGLLARHVPAEFAERQTRNLNCTACHGQVEGFPPLEILGGKLKPEWAGKFIAGEIGYKPRAVKENIKKNLKKINSDSQNTLKADSVSSR